MENKGKILSIIAICLAAVAIIFLPLVFVIHVYAICASGICALAALAFCTTSKNVGCENLKKIAKIIAYVALGVTATVLLGGVIYAATLPAV